MLQQNIGGDILQASRWRLAKNLLEEQDFDLVILDRQLPDGDGLELLKGNYGSTEANRYLIVSGRSRVIDREHGISSGVYDYISKPFSGVELVTKAKRLLAANGSLADKYVRISQSVVFLPDKQELIVDGQSNKLPPLDARLLEFLTRGELVSRAQLRAEVWDLDQCVSENAISASIHRIRRLMGKHSYKLITHYRLGYQLKMVTTAMMDTRMI